MQGSLCISGHGVSHNLSWRICEVQHGVDSLEEALNGSAGLLVWHGDEERGAGVLTGL
jgi:hypothetical protein